MLIIRLAQATDQEIALIAATLGEQGDVVGQISLWGGTLLVVKAKNGEAALLARVASLPEVAAAFSLDTPFLLSSREMVIVARQKPLSLRYRTACQGRRMLSVPPRTPSTLQSGASCPWGLDGVSPQLSLARVRSRLSGRPRQSWPTTWRL